MEGESSSLQAAQLGQRQRRTPDFLVLHVVGGRAAVVADFRGMGGNCPIKGSTFADSCQHANSDLVIASVFDKQVQ